MNNASSSTPLLHVDSRHVHYSQNYIESEYSYRDVRVHRDTSTVPETLRAEPFEQKYYFRTSRQVPHRMGLMMVGWGGNNGSTLTAALLANRQQLSWQTRRGEQRANFFGSLVMASTVRVGCDSVTGEDVYVPLHSLLPMVHPDQLVVGGWDINSADLAQAMQRAQVLEPDLQRQVMKEMSQLRPLPSIYYPDFIAGNQSERANNLISGDNKLAHLETIREQIRHFRQEHQLDKVVVVWTANTERYADILPGINDTADHLLQAIDKSHSEISPSTIFGVACVLEGVPFINGSPQNTFIPGLIELAERYAVPIGGDDFKSGQTKMKSVLVDFLVNAGIKPLAITSYNHLGNNDGLNLSAPSQFRSKEISKSNVVDDMVAANSILYAPGEHPDHTVVIKYVPSVGDSKRALDEYESEIFMGGRNTISMHNTCEDSLLASPLILDLALLCELLSRVEYRTENMTEYKKFHPVQSLLSYMLKAPLVKPGAPVVNALSKQRAALENVMRACLGLPPQHDMQMQHRLS